jgi:dihydropteroate synthase
MMERKRFTIQVKGKNYLLGERTWIMGVLNVTPDSFSDGGHYLEKEQAVERGLEMAADGADIIDVGGESTKPGSDPVPTKEEFRRVVPVLKELRKKTDVLLSVDTNKADIARAAIDAGADIVNDVSSFRFDARMISLVAQQDVPVVLMHMKGTPKTMQLEPHYEDLLAEIKSFLKERLEVAQAYGIKKEKIIIDPGIGFGKKFQDNLILINRLSFFIDLDVPILVGVSRKSFIGKILNSPPQERLEGTIAASLLSIIRGAHILRVHDVKSVRRAALVAEAILNENHGKSTEGENKNRHAS